MIRERFLTISLAVLLAFLGQSKPATAQTATYYHQKLTGKVMTNGKPYNPNRLTAAHPSYGMGTRLKVTNRKTGKSIVVTVTDRCRCILDLSSAAFRQVGGSKKKGVVPVSFYPL